MQLHSGRFSRCFNNVLWSDPYPESARYLLNRAHQPAFQAAVYLLRRVANLPLKDDSALAGVSISRVSRMQSTIGREAPRGPLK